MYALISNVTRPLRRSNNTSKGRARQLLLCAIMAGFDGKSLDRMNTSAKLFFLCGKMAAGKTTLARELAKRENAVLLVQDEFLNALYPGEITDLPGFLKCSSRLWAALVPHICDLLWKGNSVVMDFPGNTKAQRLSFRELIDRAHVEHELHFIDASDALCKAQLADRSKSLPAGAPWTTEAEFKAITAYFEPPSEEERFNVIHHERL